MTKVAQIFLIHITGYDEPGITASATSFFGERGHSIIDIEQAVIMNYLSLHFLLEIKDEKNASSIMEDLEKILSKFKVHIRIEKMDKTPHLADPATRFVVTVIANYISPKFIAKLSTAIAKEKANIDSIRKLNSGTLDTMEFILFSSKPIQVEKLKQSLLQISSEYEDVDLAIQKENLYRRSKRLIIFDMDSTLIQNEVIDELAHIVNKGEEMESLTKEAMEGKVPFEESFSKRVSLLEGLKMEHMEKALEKIKLSQGAEKLIKILKKLGYKIAIFSGGFTYFTEYLKEKLGLHYTYGNKLEFDSSGICTGKVSGPILGAQRKADLLEFIAQQEKILLDQIIAIGDGANDVLMLQKAGLGIAFNAKNITRESANTTLTKKSIVSLLYFLGITDEEIAVLDKRLQL